MKKLLVLFGLMFVIFACSNDCLNVANECLNGRYSEKNNNENNQGNSNTEDPGKRPTTLQDVVDNANAGDEIDLSNYELASYTATINKKLTIKNGSLSGANLTVTSENVKLEKLADLSVTSSSRLTINDSKLSSLLIGGNGETSRSRTSEAQTSLAMVSLTDCDIGEVQLNGFNSQLNITDTLTKIADILTSTKSMIILEAGKYDGMKDPVVTDNGELTRIDMTKDKELSVLSIYSNPKKAEYKLNEEIDLTGLIVMGTYTASVEIFKSGGWKGEATESVTKWEDEEDYDVDYDFSKTGVRIVTIKSTINPDVACNFYVYVVDDSQNNGTSQPEKIEFTNIRVESLLPTPKTSYKVGEKLDLSGYRVMGIYNGLDVNLQYTSDPANGTVLEKDVVVKFYYANQEIDERISIKVTQPYTVKFYDRIDSSKPLYTLEAVDGELLKLPSDPNRENYIFDGWYIGNEKVTSKYIVKSNLELIAKWTANGYTITYILNDGVNSEKNPKGYNVETEPIKLENATKAGYTFGGWYKDENFSGEKITQIAKGSTGNITLYAKWAANTYTVKFEANGGSGEMENQTFTYGEQQALAINKFTRDGYTFAGWSTSADGDVTYTDKQTVSNLTAEDKATVTLYAKWTKNGTVSVVVFNPPSGIAVDYGDTITLSCATEGATIYYMIGITEREYTAPIEITDNVKIVANATKDGLGPSDYSSADYTVKTYTVTYKSDYGTEPDKIMGLKKGDKLTDGQLPVLTTDGYTFAGWYDGENKIEAGLTITRDLTLTAQWTANTYTVKFEANGGSGNMDNQTFSYDDEKALAINKFTRDGYTFAGWAMSADGEKVYTDRQEVLNLTTENGGEVTLFAKWTANTDTAYKVEHYQQNINDNQYSLKDTETKKGTTGEDTSATAKTYEGFTAQSVTQVKIAADGSTVVEIYYDRKEITLTLDLDGGSGETEIKGKYGATVTKPTNPTKNSYTFDSWYPALPETFPAESSTTYTARWNELNAYYVSSTGDDTYDGTSSFPFKTMQKAVNTAITSNDGETTYTIYVMSDITGIDSEFTNGNKALINVVPGENETLHLKICGYNNADVTIDANQKGRVMYIEANANVTLENITLSNGKIINDFGGGVCIFGGNFTMSNGAVIRDCTSDVKESGGGGVAMLGGSFTMNNNAKISSCNADNNNSKDFCAGGGVYVSDGTFTLSDTASIDDCNALSDNNDSRYGGGVYLAGGKFNMTGGSIKNCDVTGYNDYGGGVYQNAGTFEMTGGTISGCTAEQGGGVYKKSGSFQMLGGTIGGEDKASGCTADLGGGVYLGSSGTSSISSGIISNCSAKQGGGVYYNGDSNNTFTMYSGEISKCTAEHGGGVYVNNGKFKMSSSAKIDACTASERGGGVYQNGGRFEIFKNTDGTNNVIISNNTAKSGGGVCVYSGTFSMNSGSISGNKVKSDSAQGGGVLVIGNFFMYDGNITNNTLEYELIDNTLTSGGAGVAVSLKVGDNGALQKGEFTMNGGEISGNTITDNYNNAKGEDLFVISGGTFTHNKGTINNDKIHNENN